MTNNLIWKFQIPLIEPTFSIETREIYRVLMVECQNDIPYMWIWQDMESKKDSLWFTIVATGEETDAQAHDHIMSFQQGPFVWHLFRGENQVSGEVE